jgi:hypothetical protein
MRSIEAVNDEGSSEKHRICLPISQNQEQTTIYLPTNSMGMDAQESSLDEIQLVYEESTKPEHQISQNIGNVRVLLNTNIMRDSNEKFPWLNWL